MYPKSKGTIYRENVCNPLDADIMVRLLCVVLFVEKANKRFSTLFDFYPIKYVRIQGFPTGNMQFCMVGDDVVEMPTNKRRFMMGNAQVVNLIMNMEKTLDEIFENE